MPEPIKNLRGQRGFTLYELLITVIVVGIVLSFGLANLGDFTRNSRMTATANDLLGAFHLARSESARAKTNVTVCASANAMNQAAADCGGTWDQGYIVFLDRNGDLRRNGADEVVLRRHDAVESGVSMTFENNAGYFSFSAAGQGRGDVNGQPAVSRVVMCDQRGNVVGAGGNSAARLFVVTPIGRGTIVSDINRIQTAINEMGVAC